MKKIVRAVFEQIGKNLDFELILRHFAQNRENGFFFGKLGSVTF